MKALKRGAIRLLSYFPKYKNNPVDSTYKDYCRTQVLMLEGLQRSYPTLPVILRNRQDNPYSFNRYSDAYRQYRQNYTYLDISLAPLYKLSPEVQARINVEDFEERLVQEDEDPVYQGNLNNARVAQDTNALGNRQIDINADWMPFVGKYTQQQPNIHNHPSRDYQKEEIAANPTELRVDLQSIGQRDLLNSKQRLLYNIVIHYFEDVLAGRNLLQLLLNVDRRIGTSKSYVIKLMSAYLQTIAARLEY